MGQSQSASRPAFFSGGCSGKSISLPYTDTREQILCCWKRVFAKTRAFSWQNSVSFGPASFVFQGQTCLLVQVSLDFLLLYSSPLKWKGHLFSVLDLEGLLGLLRTHQLQLLWHLWLGHRLGFLSCWMVCPWKWTKIILSSLRLHPSTLHFGLFCWLWGLLPFF